MNKLVALLLGIALCAPAYSNPSLTTVAPENTIYIPVIQNGEVVGSITGPIEEAKTTEEIIEESMPAVVSVEMPHFVYNVWTGAISVGESLGSGFFINDKGHIITNAHVVDTAFVTQDGPPDAKITWQVDGSTVSAYAEILAVSEEDDVALLKLKDNQQSPAYLEFGSSADVRIGASTIVLGHPLREMWSASTGIISGKDRKWGGKAKLLQTDAAVNFGNSGGPAIDSKGQVIGMTVGIKTNSWFGTFSGLGYIIPEKYINEFLDKYRI